MPKRNIVCIATSAGGVDALCELNRCLPSNLNASIFVVMHIGADSALPEILTRCGSLPAVPARDHRRYKRGCIYVAPPQHHLSIKNGMTVLTRGPRENGHRPSADVLFRSAARTHRSRVVGVVLTGGRDDGTAGLFVIKARGGVAIVQDPSEAMTPSMPRVALELVDVDFCLPIRQIANVIVQLVAGKATNITEPVIDGGKMEEKASVERPASRPPGSQVPISCPECNGPLYEVKEGELVSYQCFVGHSFSPESLTDEHTEALERAIWTAIRRLKERIVLHEELIARKRQNKGQAELINRLEESIVTSKADLQKLREVLERI